MTDPAYSERLDEAVNLALAAFRPIWRKGSRTPYITHLFSVMALVGEYGGDEDQMIAAVLHDVLEDIPGTTRGHLELRFGQRVADMVVDLSDSIGKPRPPWKERKLAYLATLKDKPADLKLVSTADKLHNCRTLTMDHRRLGDPLFERFSGRKDGTLWYYREVVAALGHGWQHAILDRLRDEVALLHELAAVPWSPEPGARP